VGVGNSVSEAFVQSTAEVTGGACELVSPNEAMAEKIVRHFMRIYLPTAESVKVLWPCETSKVFPGYPCAIYDGDTLHFFGRFKEKPNGEIELLANLENGQTFSQKLMIGIESSLKSGDKIPGTISRIAAAYEIKEMKDRNEIAATGVAYQLISPYTNCLAIDVKADNEKAMELPVLRKTPQMLAAGWGGVGKVRDLPPAYKVRDFAGANMDLFMSANKVINEPFLRTREYNIESIQEQKHRNLDNFIQNINRRHHGLLKIAPELTSIKDLIYEDIPNEMIETLIKLKDSGVDEKSLIIILLYLLSQQKQVEISLDRSVIRIFTKSYKQLHGISDDIIQKINETITSYFHN